MPTQTQALIWGDLVPQMILSAKIPRWWNVTPVADALGRAAPALRPRTAGRSRAGSATLRAQVVAALGRCAAPARTAPGARSCSSAGDVKEPSTASRRRSCSCWRATLAPRAHRRQLLPAGRDAAAGRSVSPQEVNYAAISRAFGTPKPTLANSYEPELLNLRTFPT